MQEPCKNFYLFQSLYPFLIIPTKWYKKLCEFLHVIDNFGKDKPENNYGKYFKVKPLT